MRKAALALVVALSAAPLVARADGAIAPDVQRLLSARRTLHFNVKLPGSTEAYGHAEALVAAPADKVRDTAMDFDRYRELHRKFAGARVIQRAGGSTDVYMKLPVKIGPFKVDQWEVMRFGPARTAGGTHVVEGRGIQGSMKAGHMVITVKPVDATHALLAVDLLLVPRLPAPRSLVEEELRDAAKDLVNGLKDRAQGWVGPVVSL